MEKLLEDFRDYAGKGKLLCIWFESNKHRVWELDLGGRRDKPVWSGNRSGISCKVSGSLVRKNRI